MVWSVDRLRRLAALAVLLGFEVAAAVGLYRLGDLPVFALPRRLLDVAAWEAWLRAGRAEDCLAALLRLVALGFTTYLLTATLVYLVARSVGAGGAAVAVGRGVLPAIRGVVDRAVAVTVFTAVVAGAPLTGTGAIALTAAAAEPAVVTTEPGGGLAPPALGPPSRAGPERLEPRRRDAVPVAGRAVQPSRIHVVAAGESLWQIAQRRVAAGDGEASVLAVHAYWTDLLVANRSTLRSGDPDLVQPGERLVLPGAGESAART